jgi:hypothetical protein
MNLLEMATLVSTELGVYDDTSLGLIKAFLNRNYNTMWDRYAWGDANGYGSVQVERYTALVNYPAGIDRIITVRAGTGSTPSPPGIPEVPDIPPPEPPTPVPVDYRFIDPVNSTFLIESDPTIFEQFGYVKYYEETGNASGRQIRLYPKPDQGTTLFIFGKMICPGLVADTDTSLLRNIDPALIAYAAADMLKRQRQYGKADLRRKEAQEYETVAWNLEQLQANKPRRTKATTVAGNSLGEMTDAVCTLCGQWTPDYRLIIREFLRRNYQSLYDLYLWPESLVVVRVPFTTEQVVMPPYIDKVLGIRGTTNLRMFPSDAGLILDIAPNVFDEIGDPVSYTTLTPVGVATLPAVTTRLLIASQNPADRTNVAIRGEILATGQELEETITLNGVTGVFTHNVYDIPLTIAKEITFGDVTVNAESDGMRSLEVLPSYVRELKHQRLWFLPAPDSSVLSTAGHPDTFTCLVLGKRAIRPLLTDQDTPIITGVQQVLIAAAAADLFRKLEKNDQATAMSQKASASTDVLKAKNMDQAASSPRFVPAVEPRAFASEVWCGKW